MITTPAAVAISDSAAVEVATAPTAGHALLRTRVVMYNDGPSTAYLGGADVTSTSGIPLAAGDYRIDDEFPRGCTLYARCATGQTATLRREISAWVDQSRHG